MPPSDKVALGRFEKAGRKLGINVEQISRRDYMRLPEYDGLFIRETTAIDHHTYRFARKAEAEGRRQAEAKARQDTAKAAEFYQDNVVRLRHAAP